MRAGLVRLQSSNSGVAMNDSKSDGVGFDIRAEVLKRTRTSFGKKTKAVVAIVVALVVVSQLNSAKQADDNYRARRYVVTPKLLDALNHAIPELPQLRAIAAEEAKKGTRVNSMDALFELLYAETEDAKRSAGDRKALSDKRTSEINSLSAQIDTFTDDKNGGHETQLASLIYSRAMAAAQRAADLAQFDAQAASQKAKLRDAFEDLYPERFALTSRPVFSDDKTATINAVQSAFFDEKHPIHTVFDVFWYASLIVAVLGLVYLVLVPLYRLLPFGGVQDAMEKRYEDLFSRGASSPVSEAVSSTVRSGIGVISAIVISAAALGGPIAHAAGNPLSDGFQPNSHANEDRGARQQTTKPGYGGDETKKPQHDDKTLPPDGSGGGDTKPPNTNTPPVTTLPPITSCPTDCMADVGQQIAILEKNYANLAARQMPSLDVYATKAELATAVKQHSESESVARDLAIQQAVIADVSRESRAIADAVNAHASVEAMERQKLESQVTRLDTRSVSHALAADRPSVVDRIIGVDRYVVTPAAVAAIEARYPVDDRRPENAAIQKVVSAMQSLGPISRTQIEWQIDGAVSAVAGNNTADLREVIRRAKQLVVELSRRPA
jgi:hypothetical protein